MEKEGERCIEDWYTRKDVYFVLPGDRTGPDVQSSGLEIRTGKGLYVVLESGRDPTKM